MEPVTEERLLTEGELLTLPDDGWRYELQAGLLVSEPPASWQHGDLSARIFGLLRDHAIRGRLGKVVSTETGFLLARSPDTVRVPDVAFVSNERLSAAGEFTGFFPGPPDLAVEVVAPSENRSDTHAKVADYLAAGTPFVWVVEPQRRTVTTYERLLEPRVLKAADELTGGEVLPGFSVPVETLFAD